MGNMSYDPSLSSEAKAWLQKHEAIFAGHLPAGEFVWSEQASTRIRLMQQVGGVNGEMERCNFSRATLDSDPFETILRQIALEFPPTQRSKDS